MYTFHPVLPSFRLSSPSSSSDRTVEFLANYPSPSRVAHTVGIIWTTTRQSDLSYGSDEYLCTYRWKKRNRCVKYWGTGNAALNHATINTHSQLFPSPVHERWRSHTAFFWTHPSPQHNAIWRWPPPWTAAKVPRAKYFHLCSSCFCGRCTGEVLFWEQD